MWLARGLAGQPSALLTSPGGEGAVHLWTWWASLHEARPFAFHTTLLNHPHGVDVQVIDPLHAAVYAIGAALGGPAVGWGLVVWLGLSVAGLGAALLARATGAPAAGTWVAAAAGLSGAALVGAVHDGITEGLGVGWVAVQLAVLLGFRTDPSWRRVALLAACIAAGVHAGVYNGVWIAALDVPVALWLWRRCRRPLVGGAAALALCAPYLWAALGIGGDRPGAGARHAPLPPDPRAQPWRGAWMEGADLLDLVTPAALTGAADWPTTAYLGVALLAAAAVGAARWGRGAAPWLLAAAAFAALALGPYLVVAGESLGPITPAALLELTPLGRLTRWYRAGAVAALLLAPAAAHATRSLPAALALSALILIDGRTMGPAPLDLGQIAVLPSHALVGLLGPIAEQPPQLPVRKRGTTADLNLLLQVQHGQPTTGTIDAVPGAATTGPGMRHVQRALALPPSPEGTRLAEQGVALLTRDGYRWLAVYPAQVRGTGEPNLASGLGPPVAEDARVRVYRLPPPQ